MNCFCNECLHFNYQSPSQTVHLFIHPILYGFKAYNQKQCCSFTPHQAFQCLFSLCLLNSHQSLPISSILLCSSLSKKSNSEARPSFLVSFLHKHVTQIFPFHLCERNPLSREMESGEGGNCRFSFWSINLLCKTSSIFKPKCSQQYPFSLL